MIDRFEIEANGYKYKCRRLPKEHKVIVVSSTGYSFKVDEEVFDNEYLNIIVLQLGGLLEDLKDWEENELVVIPE